MGGNESRYVLDNYSFISSSSSEMPRRVQQQREEPDTPRKKSFAPPQISWRTGAGGKHRKPREAVKMKNPIFVPQEELWIIRFNMHSVLSFSPTVWGRSCVVSTPLSPSPLAGTLPAAASTSVPQHLPAPAPPQHSVATVPSTFFLLRPAFTLEATRPSRKRDG